MTHSRTHYIPISGITIDTIKTVVEDAISETILESDIPGVAIDAKIFCEFHGYSKPAQWVPPVLIPDPDPADGDSIILLCDDLEQGFISITVTHNVNSNHTIECYDSNMNFISSMNSTSNTSVFTFPTTDTGVYYILKIFPATAGRTISSFARAPRSGYVTNYRFIEAKFYTPSLTSLASAFKDQTSFKKIEFLSTLENLTTLDNAFAGTSLEKLNLPNNLPLLSNMRYILFNTPFFRFKVDWSNLILPELIDLSFAFSRSATPEIKLPSLPKLQLLESFASNNNFLKNIILPPSLPALKNIASFVSECPYFEGNNFEYILPPLPSLENAFLAFNNNLCLKKIAFTGPSDSLINLSRFAANCKALLYLILPTSMSNITSSPTNSGFHYMLSGADSLIKLTLPLNLSSYNYEISNVTFTSSSMLQEMTTCNNWSSFLSSFIDSNSIKLKSVNQSTLKVNRFVLGVSPTIRAPVEYIDIDWSNSVFLTGIVIIIRAMLPSSEINRIFSLLPVVTGDRRIDVRYNVGYAGCDKSIATSKGWTVL